MISWHHFEFSLKFTRGINRGYYVVAQRDTTKFLFEYRAFSLTRPASMQIYENKRKCSHKKRVQLPQDWFGTPTWPPFYCFGTPIWPPWRNVKTLYSKTFHEWALHSNCFVMNLKLQNAVQRHFVFVECYVVKKLLSCVAWLSRTFSAFLDYSWIIN